MKLSKEQLINKIRNASSLTELTRLVGPSDEENEKARKRLEKIDQLDKKCEWENKTGFISNPARQARECRAQIMAEQTKFENKYC